MIIADAPNPNAAYAFLNFIHDPEIQAEETNFNGYGTPNDEAKKFIDPAILDDRAVLPARRRHDQPRGRRWTRRGNQQRIDIWQEFKSAIGG